MASIICTDNLSRAVEMENLQIVLDEIEDGMETAARHGEDVDDTAYKFIQQMNKNLTQYENRLRLSTKQLDWIKRLYLKYGEGTYDV